MGASRRAGALTHTIKEPKQMAKPPPTPPSSDIEGVNRDARVGTPSKSNKPDPGAALHHAERESKGRPDREV